MKNWIKTASIFMLLAVAMGAFGAHTVRSHISDHDFEVYKTAVLYQFIHALGLFVVAWLSSICKDSKIALAGFLMAMGILIFSGSLYILSLTGLKLFGALTPVGGLCFMAAWICLILVKY